MAGKIHVEVVEWFDSSGASWQVSLRFAVVNGQVRCTGFAVGSINDQTPVTSTLVRSVPLGALIDEVLSEPPRDLVRAAGLPPFNALNRLAEMNLGYFRPRDEESIPGKRKRGRPRKYGADHYAEVARTYMAAPTRPTVAVATRFDVPRTRAANWVRTARSLGLLERRPTEDHDFDHPGEGGRDD